MMPPFFRTFVAGLLILLARPASSEEIAVSEIPAFIYAGRSITLDLTTSADDREYRILTKSAGGDWNWDAAWSPRRQMVIHPTQPGVLFLNLQARSVGSRDVDVNRYLGQIAVRDAGEAVKNLSQSLNRLTIVGLESGLSASASRSEWRRTVDSPEALANIIRKTPTDASLARVTNSEDGQFALKAMQIVSGLWHYGNYKNILAPGCANINEQLSSPRKEMGFRDYIISDIGCCTDYALVLGSVLEAAGIQTKVIATGTHVFTEASIDGRWWTFDANIGVSYNASWGEIVGSTKHVTAYSFPIAGMQLGSPVYSEAVSNFRMFMLMTAASGLMYDYARYDFDQWVKQTSYRQAG